MNIKSKSTLKKFEDFMRVKGYSGNSIKIYLHYAEVYLSSFDCDFYHISIKETVKFLHNFKYTSRSQQNQFISSVKLLFKYIRKIELNGVDVERPRKEIHLPKVIDTNFLLAQISKIKNLKHKAIISLGFSVGLRVSEVCNLKISDIDSDRMVINIYQAKGRKDRIVPLTENMLNLFREYYKQYRPKEYMFNGQNTPKYSSTSCNKIVKKYLGEDYHFHMLRHSAFTNLTEQGVDIRVIQKLAGHSSSKTTEIYTQVSKNVLNSLPLAL